MKLVNEGDTTKAPCPTCKAIVNATYTYRDLELDSGKVVKGVMKSVCNTCSTSCGIHPQSTPKIKKVVEAKDISLEVRIPMILEDVIYNIGAPLKVNPRKTFRIIMNYYMKILQES